MMVCLLIVHFLSVLTFAGFENVPVEWKAQMFGYMSRRNILTYAFTCLFTFISLFFLFLLFYVWLSFVALVVVNFVSHRCSAEKFAEIIDPYQKGLNLSNCQQSLTIDYFKALHKSPLLTRLVVQQSKNINNLVFSAIARVCFYDFFCSFFYFIYLFIYLLIYLFICLFVFVRFRHFFFFTLLPSRQLILWPVTHA
jgi:hypothetical protein